MSKYPPIVTKLTSLCDAWLIGSSALRGESSPRDYDVFVPIKNWQKASAYLSGKVTLNTFGVPDLKF